MLSNVQAKLNIDYVVIISKILQLLLIEIIARSYLLQFNS